MRLTLPKWELGSPSRLPKLQSSIAGVKTPCIEAFFISLQNYRSVDVENEPFGHLQHKLWQKKKLEINPTPMRAGGVQCTIEKLSTRAINLLQILSQSEV
jgi:hypothetical protein